MYNSGLSFLKTHRRKRMDEECEITGRKMTKTITKEWGWMGVEHCQPRKKWNKMHILTKTN